MSTIDDQLIQLTGSVQAAEDAKQIAFEAVKAGMTAEEIPEAIRAYHLYRMFDMSYEDARKILQVAAIERSGGWDAVRASAADMGFDATTWKNPADG